MNEYEFMLFREKEGNNIIFNKEDEEIFRKAMAGETITAEESDKYKTPILLALGKKYHQLGWAMEIHIGAIRNNSTRMFNKLGPDTGFDSIDDREIAYPLSRMLDSLNAEGCLIAEAEDTVEVNGGPCAHDRLRQNLTTS